MKFAFFASVTILCRETSLIAFVPMIIYSLFNSVSYKAKKITIFWLFVPFFVFVFWKWCISLNLEPGPLVPGSGNIGAPFLGMILGFKGNLDISTNKNILQLGFWILYFVWQIWLTIQVVSSLKNSSHSNKHFILPLAIIYLTWMLFAVFLSAAIYVDDWSFVRVFSLWGMVGFLILITNKQSVAKSFNLYSILLVSLTIIRLIIKV
ncbi:MAG: hypothetical protein IPP71_02105 [Bacteroidetes bacterium]|nr:hypothetical protein [Bacteroidota bacterium]